MKNTIDRQTLEKIVHEINVRTLLDNFEILNVIKEIVIKLSDDNSDEAINLLAAACMYEAGKLDAQKSQQ